MEAKGLRDIMSMDFVGKLPQSTDRNSYICTMVNFSRYLVAYKVRNATTSAAIKCAETYVIHLGIVRALTCDNSPYFRYTKFMNAREKKGVKVYFFMPYQPQSNPVEHLHRENNREDSCALKITEDGVRL